jgi:uncharacterized protein YaaQ
MKLIIAIVRDELHEPVSHALTTGEFRVTYVASTGGFLRRGSTTLLIGVKDERVEQALEIIRANCPPATDSKEKNATIFVVNVDQYTQI